MSKVQLSDRSNRTQCCQRLATAAIFVQKKMCCPGAMMKRWAPPTRNTLQHNTASITKDLICLMLSSVCFSKIYYALKEIKMLELETLLMFMNTVLVLIRLWPQIFKKWLKPYFKISLRKRLNFTTKIANF